jgi:hypothetical protein
MAGQLSLYGRAYRRVFATKVYVPPRCRSIKWLIMALIVGGRHTFTTLQGIHLQITPITPIMKETYQL